MTKWLVLWVRGGRIGSVPLTEESLAHYKLNYCTDVIQTDITGTVHLNILGLLPKRKAKPCGML